MASLQSKHPPVEKRSTSPEKKRAPIKPAPIPRPTLLIQRKATCACGGGCPRCEQNAAPASLNEAQKHAGYPLDADSRSYFEPRLGRELGQVRIHNDSSANDAARNMKARAFTVGQEIHFAAGEFNPASQEGRRLLAHELVHTVQQGELRTSQPKLQISQPADASEMEADRVAGAIVNGAPAQVSNTLQTAPHIARQPEGAPKQPDASAGAATGDVPLSDLLPFTDTGWDGATILKIGQIDPASAIGTAVTAGPKEVNALNEKLYSDLLKELDTLLAGDRYINAVTEAGSASAIFSLSLKTQLASYGELRRIARASAAFAQPPKERRRSLLAWADQPTPAKGLVGTEPPEPIGLRENVVAQLDKWAETTEGVDKVAAGRPKFSEFRTAASLKSTRESYAKNKGTTFTTCVEFLAWALKNGVADAHANLKVSDNLINTNLWDPKRREELPKDAWTTYTTETKERPKPGDIYMLIFAQNVYKKPNEPKVDANIKNYKGSFSHIGFIRSITVNAVKEGEEPTETWEGVDGGAGTATIYKYQGVDKETQKDKYSVTQAGAEKIETAVRVFYPRQNIFPAGVKNQDQGPRHLLGWLNIEKLI
jgi:Domain of unknown function (DUF4157)